MHASAGLTGWRRCPHPMADAASACALLGEGITDDTLLNIARFLPSSKDLLNLCLASPRFAAKIIPAPSGGGGGAAAAAPEMLTIVEDAGRWWVACCSEQERGWVPRHGLANWLGLMQEVEQLRVPLVFGRAHGSFTLSEDGAVASRNGDEIALRSAASTAVMRSGRHFAQFTVVAGGSLFGAIRPGWDVAGEAEAHVADGHCFYGTYIGWRWPGRRDWEGRKAARVEGDRIGMLLDLDQGSMTVWKNDIKLGVMVAEGLSGPLCWAISMADPVSRCVYCEFMLKWPHFHYCFLLEKRPFQSKFAAKDHFPPFITLVDLFQLSLAGFHLSLG